MTVGAGVVARARLLPRLDAAVTHRLTTVVADAGFGKSELLDQWLAARQPDAARLVRPAQRDVAGIASALVGVLRERAPEDAARLALVVGARQSSADQDRADALAGMLCSALQGLPTLHVLVVVDDAHLMTDTASRFVESLLRQSPPTLHLLLLSRHDPGFAVDRLPDPVQRFDGTDLGLDDDELALLLVQVVGDDEHAAAVRSLLGRWPAAVRLAAEALSRVSPDRRTAELLRIKTEGDHGLLALANEVFSNESPRNRRLAQVVAPYDGFTVELAQKLGCDDAAATVEELLSRGILNPVGDEDHQFYGFPKLMREFVRATLQLDPDERPGLVRVAGEYFEEHGQFEGALRCAVDQQDSAWVARLLRAHGRLLIERGRDARVALALGLVAEHDRDAALDEVQGALHDARGDHVHALHFYGRAADAQPEISPWLAYRIGFLQYVRGDLDAALDAFRAAHPGAETADQALLQAWQATVHWARGQIDEGWAVAAPALELATRLDDPQALAAAHTVMAMLCAHRGDREGNKEHYDRALVQAERAGDVMQVVRIRNNRGSRLLEEAELDAALAELEVAIELAEASGLRFYLSLALANRGELRFQQGQYDAAVADLEAARDLDRAAGTPSTSSALVHLGHVYRHRGYANQARLAYEEALEAGRNSGDVNLIVPALCGVAQLLTESDPELARHLADEALSYDPGLGRVVALTTAAWVGLADGRTEEAYRWACEAVDEAVGRRDRLGQAEAFLLAVLTDPSAPAHDDRLDLAAALVEQIGAPVWRARIRLEQARRLPPAEALVLVEEVGQLAAMLGARNLADRASALARSLDVGDRVPPVELITLGGFRVRRAGRTVSLSDWPDEASPALLKRLTSVPSLTWTRPALQRSLWPGGTATEEQLDAAIAGAQRALDPSGEHEFLRVHGDQVSLVNADVDVHAFLTESASGLMSASGRDVLRRAESRYSGDYLEEHPGETWAVTLREEARGRYVEVCRALAGTALRDGEHDAAARYSRRILERDPYDEGAHLALVAALAGSGRSQEARSCYATYVARSDELGLEAIPWAMVSETVAA